MSTCHLCQDTPSHIYLFRDPLGNSITLRFLEEKTKTIKRALTGRPCEYFYNFFDS